VFLSSRAVYGEGRYECAEHATTYGAPCCSRALPEPSRETDPHHPASVYGTTKSDAEAAMADARVPVSVIRPQNVIGPGQSLHNPYTGVLAAFLAQLRDGRPVTVYGDGHQTRDFVHVRDLTALIVWCLANPATRVMNCGTGTRTSLLELASFSAAAAPVSNPGITHVDVTRAGDIVHACASLTEVVAAGAPVPRTTTEAGVAEFIRWGWDRPGAKASAWDEALETLVRRGLAGAD
jgi:dTDP-L-rhamnose 4-epimerase